MIKDFSIDHRVSANAKPFTVIGGFLGAGKTTLINHLLGAPPDPPARYAILVNDFGALNIDRTLIRSHDGKTLALANGCICCSLADGFINTLLRLMRRPDDFDQIIVEASGVAEPQRIMDIARLDPQLRPDAIIVVADAVELSARLDDDRIAAVVAAQLRSADLLLLNKIDSATAAQRAAADAALRAHNDTAPIVACRNAAVAPALLSGAPPRRPGVGDRRPADDADRRFVSVHYRADAPLHRDDFDALATTLPQTLLRGKGVVRFADDPQRWLCWQRVGRRSTLSVCDAPQPPTLQLVLIAAAGASADATRRELDRALATIAAATNR